MKLIFQNGSTEPKVAASMIQATHAETGKPVKAAVITFTDDTKAVVSAKHFTANGTPKFLTEDLAIANGYEITTIQGTPWIVETNNRSNIKLS
jgi:hypothetical protein